MVFPESVCRTQARPEPQLPGRGQGSTGLDGDGDAAMHLLLPDSLSTWFMGEHLFVTLEETEEQRAEEVSQGLGAYLEPFDSWCPSPRGRPEPGYLFL